MSVKVQMLARWSELSMHPNNIDPEEAEIQRVISGDYPEQNMIKAEIKHEYGPVVFYLNKVVRYNRAKEGGHTVVHFKGGDVLILKIPFLDYVELDIEHNGQQILDFTPPDYMDPDEEERDNETDSDLEL